MLLTALGPVSMIWGPTMLFKGCLRPSAYPDMAMIFVTEVLPTACLVICCQLGSEM